MKAFETTEFPMLCILSLFRLTRRGVEEDQVSVGIVDGRAASAVRRALRPGRALNSICFERLRNGKHISPAEVESKRITVHELALKQPEAEIVVGNDRPALLV